MSKLHDLIKRKEEELDVKLVMKVEDEHGHAHIMCERLYNQTYVVFTAFYTGISESTYDNFYNGKYDLDYKEAFRELTRRTVMRQSNAS